MNTEEISKAKEAAMEAITALGAAMAPQARELAEQKAEEEGVGIEDVFVMVSPCGEMRATLLS